MDSIDKGSSIAVAPSDAVSLAAAGCFAASDLPELPTRVSARGKFLFVGVKKLWVRGVACTREPIRADGDAGDRGTVERVLEQGAACGANALWLHGNPSERLLDSARDSGLRFVIVPDISYPAGFLDDRATVRGIVQATRETVEMTRNHPAILCYALGPTISDAIIRWHGANRIERFIERLYTAVREVDADCLVTCENFATAPHLKLPFLDIACFHVGSQAAGAELGGLIRRLHNLCGEKPLLLTGLSAGETCDVADVINREQPGNVSAVFECGGAGAFVELGSIASTSSQVLTTGVFRDTPFATGIDWPRISIVVCSYNGAATIRDTLEGITALEYPNFQAIVVNDGSTDATASIAAHYDVELISTENRGLSNARNTGWQAADGEIVAYIDDDAYPDPHWLHYLALTFMRTSYVGVGGPNIAPPGDGLIADCVANAPGGPVHVLLTDSEAEHIPGCNMAFKREALREIGGFDARYRAAGDDVDLCWRLQEQGWKIGFSPAAVVWHHRRNSVLTYWKQQQGYGKAEALLVEKWPDKYNVLGHYSWSGRLYGKGLTQPLRLYGNSIDHHAGVAPVQSMRAGDAGLLAMLPLMPEWFVLVGGFGVLTLLGLSWSPLLWFAPLLVLSALVQLVQAAMSGMKAEFPTRHASGYVRMKLRILTAFLHVMQPLARLKGRLQNGLTPWRNRVHVFPTWQVKTTVDLDGGEPVTPKEFAERLAARARGGQAGRAYLIRRGTGTDSWDVEIVGGLFGNARILVGPRSAANGGQLVARTWSRLSPAAVVVVAVGVLVSAVAAQQAGWVAAGVIGVAAVSLALAGCIQAGSAHAALHELLADAASSPPATEGRSAT